MNQLLETSNTDQVPAGQGLNTEGGDMEEVIEHETALALIPHDAQITRPPQEVLDGAIEAAKALKNVISQKKKPVIFRGEQYLQYEDWQTIAGFFGTSVATGDAELIDIDGVRGFRAKARVIDGNGIEVSSAQAYCMKDEDNWSGKPLFQLASMAQTRAGAKALRNKFAWVAVLAGYSPTPAEEMTGEQDAPVADDVPNCPDCNGQMWDNRATKKGRQPDFKCKDKACNKAVWVNANDAEIKQLKQAITDQCRLLNEYGDETVWTVATLNEYAVKHFGTTADKLELQPLRDLAKKLNLHYDEIRKQPTVDQEAEAKAAETIKIKKKYSEKDIETWLKNDHEGKTLEQLTLDQLLTADDSMIPF